MTVCKILLTALLFVSLSRAADSAPVGAEDYREENYPDLNAGAEDVEDHTEKTMAEKLDALEAEQAALYEANKDQIDNAFQEYEQTAQQINPDAVSESKR